MRGGLAQGSATRSIWATLIWALVLAASGFSSAETLGSFGGEPMFRDMGATRAKVQRMLAAPPSRCTSSGPDRLLCTWRVEPGESAHSMLAGGRLDTPIQVLCAFPVAPNGGAPHCTSHRPIPLHAIASTGAGKSETAPDRLARQEVDAARTIEALSRLLGAGPNDCRQRDERDWVCYWRADPEDPAYATLGALVDVSGPARLICLLPMDGSSRGKDSCRVTREPDLPTR